jgi:uncharacterized protein YceK
MLRTSAGLGLFVALACGGCGTLHNLNPKSAEGEGESPPTRIYGGVRQDWITLKELDFSDVACINLVFLPLYLAALPLSFVGDTLTLPYTTAVEVNRAFNDYYFPKPAPTSEPR